MESARELEQELSGLADGRRGFGWSIHDRWSCVGMGLKISKAHPGRLLRAHDGYPPVGARENSFRGDGGGNLTDGTNTDVGSPYLTEESKKALVARLARIEGHVRAISKMVDERDWADEILLQVTAVKGALNRFASTLVEDELKACLSQCEDPQEQEERIDRLTRVLATMLKQT